MSPFLKYALCGALGMAVAAPAHATVLTFDGLAGPDGTAFTTLTEAGFTISFFDGNVFQNLLFGNGAPSLTLANNSSPYGSIFIQRTDGGAFNPLNVDLSGADFGVFGYLGGELVGGYFASSTNGFATYSLPPGLVDLLTISATPLEFENPALLDNLELEVVGPPVPEPASWMLMMAGFSMLGFTMRNKKHVVRVKYS